MNIFKYFEPRDPLEGGHNAKSVTRGTCIFNRSDSEDQKYECVEKVFENKKSFDEAIKAFTFLDTKDDLKSFLPEVYHKDEEALSVKMAYFHCTTIAKFFQTTDIFEKRNHWMVNGILLSLNNMLDVLIKHKVFHGDLNAENVLICPLSNSAPMVDLKIIDLDSVSRMDEGYEFGDSSTLSLEIRSYIKEQIRGKNMELRDEYSKQERKIEKMFSKKKISRRERNNRLQDVQDSLSSIFLDSRVLDSIVNKKLESFSNCGKLALRNKGEDDDYNIPLP